MKITLLVLTLVLTGLELQAQLPGGQAGPAGQPGLGGRRPRYGVATNGPSTSPRYQPGIVNPAAPGNPGATPGAPGALPGGLPGAPGGAVPGTPGAPGGPGAAPGVPLSTAYNASPAFAAQEEEMIEPGLIHFEGVEISQVLDIYAKLVHRTLLRAALPQAQIILQTQTPLTRTEAIQALQAVLALNGVSLVNIGEKFVKVVPSDQAGAMGGDIDRTGSTNIPSLGTYTTHIVQLKYVKPTEMVPVIQPFARLANSILPIDGNGILVLRDYAENVKRMLEMIEQVDVSVPAEYISEVIPIRYAKVDDIASALNALGGGGGGATVSIGTAPGSGQISGLAGGGRSGGLGGGFGTQGGIGGMGGGSNPYGGSGGLGGGGGFGQRAGYGQTTPNGTPSGGAQSFQQRLQNIISSTGSTGSGGAGGKQDQIQLFGQTKIIPNESSSTLLIYATRGDMDVIKGIILKLDVPLQQVLIEAAIIDYSLGPNTFQLGISASQNPLQNGQAIGAGGYNNSGSAPFIHFMQALSVVTNGLQTNGFFNSISTLKSIVSSASGSNSVFGNNLPGGLSYFGSIGPTWDLALNAAASDSHASVIQRPRIQASQAKPAQFFVGDTVPYVTGNSYGTAYGSGVSYSQLSVGVELDVTPFINPDGLVVMDIQQEIDDLNGFTTIDNVGQVPNTIKRTLNTEIAVRDRDTVMLGGFIKANKSTSRSGVPFLMDIPIIGNLFLQRNDSKSREELIVLMRPTVLATPDLAAEHTAEEQRRLPGVARAESENAQEERKLIETERKRETREYKADPKNVGPFTPGWMNSNTNKVQQDFTEPRNRTTPQAPPQTEIDEVTPVRPAVHPEAGMVPTPPERAEVAPPPVTPPVTENSPVAPLDSAAMQKKAQEALAQKMMELNSTNSAR